MPLPEPAVPTSLIVVDEKSDGLEEPALELENAEGQADAEVQEFLTSIEGSKDKHGVSHYPNTLCFDCSLFFGSV